MRERIHSWRHGLCILQFPGKDDEAQQETIGKEAIIPNLIDSSFGNVQMPRAYKWNNFNTSFTILPFHWKSDTIAELLWLVDITLTYSIGLVQKALEVSRKRFLNLIRVWSPTIWNRFHYKKVKGKFSQNIQLESFVTEILEYDTFHDHYGHFMWQCGIVSIQLNVSNHVTV